MFKKRKHKTIHWNEGLLSIEQMRMIRTNIENSTENKPVLLMVASPHVEEKKALISSKLALSFAEQKKKVLLVDANLRSPSLHEYFKVDNLNGLTNVIIDDDPIHKHVKQTFMNDLMILPTGPVPNNPSDVWISNKVEESIRKWNKDFEIIIMETPAFLTVSDAKVLVKYCDEVILVVKENHTKKEEILKMKHDIEKANKRILGVIYHTG